MKVMNPSSHNRMVAPTPTQKATNTKPNPGNALPVRKWSHVNFNRFIHTVQELERDDDLKLDSIKKSSTMSHTQTSATVTPSESASLMEQGQTSASTSLFPSRSGITSASTLNTHLSYSEEDEKEYVSHKSNSFVMMGRRPVAMVTMSSVPSATDATDTDATASSSTIPSSISTLHKNPTRELLHELKSESEKKNEPEEPTVQRRVFRIYKPGFGRTSMVLSIGKKFASAEAEKIFEASKMRTKTYKEWRKEAAAQLPSATGGPPIEHLEDAVAAIPRLSKEKDPRELHNKIKRLSLESSGVKQSLPLAVKKHKRIPAVGTARLNVTKAREINNAPKKKEDVQVQKSKSIVDPIDDDDDEGNDNSSVFDEDRLLELERYQAGVDIKAKIEGLRNLSDKLSHKRRIRQKLVELATGFTVLDEEDIPIKEHLLYVLEHMGETVHDALSFVLIWDKQIREINGKFGTVVANYFVWVRKMVGLEILAFTLTNAIIIIPQIVEQIEETPTIRRAHIPFHIADLINGERYFEYSYLYYSGYHNRNEDSSNPFRNPAFRFLFCMLVMFLIFTYFIFSRLTKYYHSIRLESTVSGVANMRNFKGIICGWDFNCQDDKAKMYLHKTIRRELKMLADTARDTQKTLLQYEAEEKKILAYCIKKFGLFWGPWAIHIVGNFLIFGACVLIGVILFELCRLKLYYYVECVPYRDDDKVRVLDEPLLCPKGDLFLYTWILSLPALFASISTLLLTKFIVMIGDSETWNTPERKIYGTMIRAGVFNFTNIIAFYSFWISSKEVLRGEGFTAETIFGKELYRLVVIQGVTDVFLNLVVKGVYHLIWRKSENYKMTEFRTEYGTLNMFFIHSVSRISILFCPPMSFFVILRLVVDYYQNRFSLLHLSSQEGYFAHASHVYAPFLLTFFILCYLITSFMNVYYLTDTAPSSFAGPFIKYNISYDQVLGEALSKKSKVDWLIHLTEPVFLYTFLSILAALAYFCRQWALAYEPIAVTLNDQISLERADRDLLLKAIFEIGKVTTEEVEDNEHDPRKLTSRMKRVAISTTHIPGMSQSQAEETDDEDIADKHIAELIHRVQRRKSLDYAGRTRSSGGTGRMSTHAQKQHLENVEAMVAMIVDERKKMGGMSQEDISVNVDLSETSLAMIKHTDHHNHPQHQQHSQNPRSTPHPQQQQHQNPSPNQHPGQRQSRKIFDDLTKTKIKSTNVAGQNQNPYSKYGNANQKHN